VVAGFSNLSMRRTGIANRFNSIAAVIPVGPAPTIKTGLVEVMCLCGQRRGFIKNFARPANIEGFLRFVLYPIDEQFNTCDITAIIGCKEGDGFCDVIRSSHPLQGYGAKKVLV
jgi:hypothetical protein